MSDYDPEEYVRTIPKNLSIKQYETMLTMNEHAKERNCNWNIHVLKRFFDIRRIDKPVILGSFSWSSSAIKTKWLSAPHVDNYGGGYVTPGDLARDYLAIKYPDRRIKCTTKQWKECVENRAEPPLYCVPSQLENAAYLDLSGAFWQIVRAVGWDVGYLPGQFLVSNSRMYDFPHAENKMARNCLVSVGIPAPMRMWTGSEIQFVRKPSKFVNMLLWRLVQDVLNGIAADMVDAGALYVYTDGYILPRHNLNLGFEILDMWGLEGRVKQYGKCDIVTTANYAFWNEKDGFTCTKIYRKRRNALRRGVNKINSPNRKWLRGKFLRFAEYAKHEWECL